MFRKIENLMSYRANKQKGFSLLELLIYVAIFGGVLLVVANFLVTILAGRDSVNARYEVLQNTRFASESIRRLVYSASSFRTTGACPSNALEVFDGSATSTVSLATSTLILTTPTTTNSLTSDRVSVSIEKPCLFTEFSNPYPATSTLQFGFIVRYNDGGNPQLEFSNSIQSTVSPR